MPEGHQANDDDQQADHDRDAEVRWLGDAADFIRRQVILILWKMKMLVNQGHAHLEQVLDSPVDGQLAVSRQVAFNAAEQVGPHLGSKLAVQVAARIDAGLLGPVFLHVDDDIDGLLGIVQP